ncbi:MAG TPA: hypothetical protein PLO59_10675, partial [Bacteroidia bacterium]|nr:hypothetical protein [Bacteroidia bacterium]
MRFSLVLIFFITGLKTAWAQVQFVKEYIPNTIGKQINVLPSANGFKIFTLDSFKLSNFDLCGNSVLCKKYFLPVSATVLGDVKQLANGDLVVLSRKDYINTSGMVLTRISDNGNVIWSFEYGDNIQSLFPYTVSEDQMGNLYVFMNAENSVTNQVQSCVLKTDNTGNIIWSNFYGYGIIWGGGITTNDGGFLFRTGNTLIKLDG